MKNSFQHFLIMGTMIYQRILNKL